MRWCSAQNLKIGEISNSINGVKTPTPLKIKEKDWREDSPSFLSVNKLREVLFCQALQNG